MFVRVPQRCPTIRDRHKTGKSLAKDRGAMTKPLSPKLLVLYTHLQPGLCCLILELLCPFGKVSLPTIN
jgi:hypothetical protein